MHKGRRPAVRVVLDEISHGTAPTTYLQQLAAGDRAEQQLGTLGSGNHFLEVRRAISSPSQSAVICGLARQVLCVCRIAAAGNFSLSCIHGSQKPMGRGNPVDKSTSVPSICR